MKNVGLNLSQFEEIDSVELFLDGTAVNSSIPSLPIVLRNKTIL